MPVSAQIDKAARLVVTTATGILSKADFIAHIEKTWRDETIVGFDELVDATTADVSQLSAEDLSEIVNSGVQYDPNSDPRLALCVSSDLAFGIGRMFGMMRETHAKNSRTVKIFRDVASASAWLAERHD